jgi:hypothetical protein
MSTGYVATLPKAVRFDHIKGIDDSRTKEQRSFKLYGTTAE